VLCLVSSVVSLVAAEEKKRTLCKVKKGGTKSVSDNLSKVVVKGSRERRRMYVPQDLRSLKSRKVERTIRRSSLRTMRTMRVSCYSGGERSKEGIPGGAIKKIHRNGLGA